MKRVCTKVMNHGAGRIYSKYLGRPQRPSPEELLSAPVLDHVRRRLRGDLELYDYAEALHVTRLARHELTTDAADARWRAACCPRRPFAHASPECAPKGSHPKIGTAQVT